MFKTLVRKQIKEYLRGILTDVKTGKARSKSGIVLYIFLYIFVIFSLFAAFFGMAEALSVLRDNGLAWLYYALLGMIAIALGSFMSVFTTYSSLYLAKDNDLLLSMPIPPMTILGSRMVIVCGASLLFCGVVWIPAVLHTWFNAFPGTKAAVFCVLIWPLMALLVTAVTCLLGWLLALFASRTKRKSLVTTLIAVIFICVYYPLCFRMEDLVGMLINNSEAVGQKLKVWTNLLYQMGQGASGDVKGLIIFAAVCIALFAVCMYILSRSFIGIVTRAPAAVKTEVKKADIKVSSLRKSLLKKEFKRFTSSSLYMMNCALGVLFMLAAAVALIIKKDQIPQVLDIFREILPEADALIPILLTGSLCALQSINDISTPSISLEGKHLWVIRSLPVRGADVLQAKLDLHIAVCAAPAVIAAAAAGYAFELKSSVILQMCLVMLLFTYLTGTFGLIVGLKRPNFTWTSEALPLKQSINIVIALAGGLLITVLFAGGAYLLRNSVDTGTYLTGAVVIMAAAENLLLKWMKTKGSDCFDSL